jgi:hypothetical protein
MQVIQRSQAPKRDTETKAKWKVIDTAMQRASESEGDQMDHADSSKPRAFCDALEFLLDRLNAMRIDAANARLRVIAPVIQDHGIDYQRAKFQVLELWRKALGFRL